MARKNLCHGNYTVPSPDRDILIALGECSLAKSCELWILQNNSVSETPQTLHPSQPSVTASTSTARILQA